MMTDRTFSIVLVLCAVLICIASTQPAPEEEDNLSASDWKKKGDEALKLKMLDVATDAYTKAIEKEPDNYLYYYHRALVFSFRGRASLAIKDYTSTIERNPTHTTSFMKRGQLYMDIGNFDEAEVDFTAATKLKGSTTAASDGLEKLFVARDLLKQLEKTGENHQQVVDILTALIQLAPACEKYLLLRAEAYMRLDNYKDAISDSVNVLRANPRNMDAHWLIGKANFLQGDYEYALQAYKKALSFDPENKLFIKQIKLTKQITKGLGGFNENFQAGRWEEALGFYNNLIQSAEGMDKNILLVERSCKCLLETKKYKEAIDACTKALAQNPGLFEAQMWRGEAHMMLDDFQAARNDFQGASQVNPHDQRLQQAYQRLERKEKIASRKDYYKILGIPKDAQPAQIKKAYRKLALEFHPDKHTDKVAAEIKFQEITEAYEVIGDEEKRGKYDRGEDLQPRQQQHNPFQHGFPFKFSFH